MSEILDLIADAIGWAEGSSDADRGVDLTTAREVLRRLEEAGYEIRRRPCPQERKALLDAWTASEAAVSSPRYIDGPEVTLQPGEHLELRIEVVKDHYSG